MAIIDFFRTALGGQFELQHLFLVIFIIVTLVIAERYYNRKR
jgi:hypothetical protein